jgi:hypothetical protein
MEWTLYPNSSMRALTWAISSGVECSFMEMIIVASCFPLKAPLKAKDPLNLSGPVFLNCSNFNQTPLVRDLAGKIPAPKSKRGNVAAHRN